MEGKPHESLGLPLGAVLSQVGREKHLQIRNSPRSLRVWGEPGEPPVMGMISVLRACMASAQTSPSFILASTRKGKPVHGAAIDLHVEE